MTTTTRTAATCVRSDVANFGVNRANGGRCGNSKWRRRAARVVSRLRRRLSAAVCVRALAFASKTRTATVTSAYNPSARAHKSTERAAISVCAVAANFANFSGCTRSRKNKKRIAVAACGPTLVAHVTQIKQNVGKREDCERQSKL